MTLSIRIACLLAVLFVPSTWAQRAAGGRVSAALPSVSELVESVKDVVVNVEVTVEQQGLFGKSEKGGAGSGFIIDARGLVLTNNHVVENAKTIRVRLDDGRVFAGEVLGRDPLTDIALLLLKGKVSGLPVAVLGDSEGIKPGDWVVAIGNPFGLASSVSVGIVSARARNMGIGPYDEYIQTDAAINPGNSGGPLFNMRGQVVGINTAIISGGGGGLGFAVPVNVAKAIVPMLESDGVVTRGWLGLVTQDFNSDLALAMKIPALEGAMVTGITPDSPVKDAGLKMEDIIVEWDGKPVRNRASLIKMVALSRPGSKVDMSVYRGSKKMEMKVAIGTRPDIEGVGVAKRAEKSKDAPKPPKLGLIVQDSDGRVPGIVVTGVTVGSAAERAGLWVGAVIIEVDRRPVKSSDEFIRYVKGTPPGTALLLKLNAGPEDEKRLYTALVIP